MRRSRLCRAIIWLSPGCLLWLSCPSGTGPFLAQILQPALSQVASDIAGALTENLFNPPMLP